MTRPLKLTVEPVPVTSTGKSLSALLPKHRWRALGGRDQHFALHRAANPHVYHREDHFMWVNDFDFETLVGHVEAAAEVCFRRSQHEWRMDFGEFAEMLDG